MKVLDACFLMLVFPLLRSRVQVFANFMFNLNSDSKRDKSEVWGNHRSFWSKKIAPLVQFLVQCFETTVKRLYRGETLQNQRRKIVSAWHHIIKFFLNRRRNNSIWDFSPLNVFSFFIVQTCPNSPTLQKYFVRQATT